MSAQEIVRHTPYLRRYARALTGSQGRGDGFVQAALEALAAGDPPLEPGLPVKTALFKVFHTVWRRSPAGHAIDAPGHGVDRGLAQPNPERPTALLLIMMEGFSLREASQVLDLSLEATQASLEAAGAAVERQLATDVLIVEDEPIVALDLDRLVRDLGHTVIGVAATRDEALAAAQTRRLGLILADVRLADGSSGFDVATKILRDFDIPVIFITAFPERLLTGKGPEPAFLVAKPYQDATVRALIAQALFFHETPPTPPDTAMGTSSKLSS